MDRLVDQLPGAVAYDPSTAATADQIVVYDAIVPNDPVGPRYVVVYADTGARSSESICGTSDELGVTALVHSVVFGEGLPLGAMCRWLASKVRDALTDWKPEADDGTLSLMRHDLSITPRRDEQITARPTVYAVDRFTVAGTV